MEQVVLLLSVLGFINAFYLHYQYKQYKVYGKEMFCLIGGKCADVVSSKFGTTFGIKNEVIGMAYYGLLSIYLLVSILIPSLGQNLIFLAKIATFVALIFSIYLLFVQTAVLKTLCSWCLIAIFINILIFYFLTFTSNSL